MSAIDTTGLDVTKPEEGNATTASVRDNFANIKANLDLAKVEIEAATPQAIDTLVASVDAVSVGFSDTTEWRDRCAHTSWENETLNTATRGSTRKIPAKVFWIATTDTVTLYDTTDPSVPMWMVFNGDTAQMLYASVTLSRPFSSIAMLNGIISVGALGGGFGGLSVVNFLKDSGVYHASNTASSGMYKGNIAQRNDNLAQNGGDGTPAIVNDTVNDVAMTILPDAPVDQTTGLQVPTIAVATDGGVSVITDGGDVWDIVQNNASHVSFTDDDRMYIVAGGIFAYGGLPTVDHATFASWYDGYYSNAASPALFVLGGVTGNRHLAGELLGSDDGLTLLKENPDTPAEGMVNYITKDYQSGWMHGDIKASVMANTTAGVITEVSTTLNGAVDISQTTITVVDTTSFLTAGTVAIDNEAITYTGKTATTLTGCTRGARNSVAATHLTAVRVYMFNIEDRSINGPY